MLEAVKMRLTSKIAGGTVFTFEGKNIPDHLVLYLKSAFPNVPAPEDVPEYGPERYENTGKRTEYEPGTGEKEVT